MSVLYVDHEINNLNSFKATFRRDATVYIANSTKEGLQILSEKKIDVIFADHQMPGMTGLEFLKLASSQYPGSTRVLLTGNAYTDEFKMAADQGYFHTYVNKPWDEHQLRHLIVSPSA
ncbi:response regulator [Dyadobacter arcticus]|uniref:Response regulator RpfG family c-di-GMP phosphodiesterase n=1 Tax=Dyadobacter arcticus TaxID=1078754 RepID=A0ABX0UTR6_9BACT|nr:response regulator [Dyadobacter arcticus]NIJ55030.1 response regulator RpfG family c-di-GMP phosphodiesterase [Dyadobacter arcticus]